MFSAHAQVMIGHRRPHGNLDLMHVQPGLRMLQAPTAIAEINLSAGGGEAKKTNGKSRFNAKDKNKLLTAVFSCQSKTYKQAYNYPPRPQAARKTRTKVTKTRDAPPETRDVHADYSAAIKRCVIMLNG